MRRTWLYFLGAVLEAARYFILVRFLAELLGARADTARVLLHLAAPQLLVAGGLAALSHDPDRYDFLRGFLAAAKTLSVATGLALIPELLGAGSSEPGSRGPAPGLVFLAIAVWDLGLAIALSMAKPPRQAPVFPSVSVTETLALDEDTSNEGRP